ncbi:MAG: rhodanese-like domain-containing protein, partial [Methanobacterium sp.]
LGDNKYKVKENNSIKLVRIIMSQFITITPQAALKLIEEKNSDIIILDIRPKEEFVLEHLPGAVNLDYDGHKFQEKVDKLDKEKNYLIYCKSGVRGGYFMDKMRDSGFHGAYNILGGFVGWKINKLPLQSNSN